MRVVLLFFAIVIPSFAFAASDVLRYTYHFKDPQIQALTNVSLEVSNREALIMIGPSGSGKSTILIHMLGALDNPTGGDVEVTLVDEVGGRYTQFTINTGLDFSTMPGTSMGFGPQGMEVGFGGPDLKIHVQAAETHIFGILAIVFAAQKKVDAVMGPSRPPPFEDSLFAHEVSLVLDPSFSGQKVRPVLAQALVLDPSMIILDEPFTGVDEQETGETGAVTSETSTEAVSDAAVGSSLVVEPSGN